jgi:two-component system, chemotaxis family, protein-glutamate methylesterase/glutaminase
MPYELIIVGCSLGGLNAMQIVLADLGRDLLTPMILIQHRDKSTGLAMIRVLQKCTHLNVMDADDKANIVPGNLYVAPAGYHLLVDEKMISLSTEMPIKHAQPSIDVAFDSAARSYKKDLIGVVLTSSSVDGAQGAACIELHGGCLIVQDPKTAENGTLPKAALAVTTRAKVVKLEEIAPVLTKLCGSKGGANAVRSSR